jgi:hypothetical protein
MAILKGFALTALAAALSFAITYFLQLDNLSAFLVGIALGLPAGIISGNWIVEEYL